MPVLYIPMLGVFRVCTYDPLFEPSACEKAIIESVINPDSPHVKISFIISYRPAKMYRFSLK